MELKPRDRIVQLKILYYGPAIGGKTTNLQVLHAAAQGRHRGEFITVNSQQDRTILFDLLPLRGVGFHGFDIRFQLVAVPGQAPYVMARKLVTRGTDGVVFVANSAADRLQENLASLQEMNGNLSVSGIDPADVPVVFQYNKRDLRDVLPVEDLNAALNRQGARFVESVAIRGDGVLETLGMVVEKTMEHLTTKYRSLALEPGETVQAWSWGTVQQMFGATTLAGRLGPSPGGGGGSRLAAGPGAGAPPGRAGERGGQGGEPRRHLRAGGDGALAVARHHARAAGRAAAAGGRDGLCPTGDRDARRGRARGGDARGDARPPGGGGLVHAGQPHSPCPRPEAARRGPRGNEVRPLPRERVDVRRREEALRHPPQARAREPVRDP